MLPLATKPHPLAIFRSWLASDKSFHARIVASASAGAAVIALLACVFLSFQFRERSTGQLRDATFEALRLAGLAESDLGAMEGALREFLLSGAPDDLSLFEKRQTSLHLRVAQLSALVSGEREQSRRIGEIHQSLGDWESRFAGPQVVARSEGKLTSNTDRTRGSVVLADVRTTLASLSQTQIHLWQQAMENADAEQRWQTWGFGLLTVSALALFLASNAYSYRAFRRHLGKVQNAEGQLRVIVDNTLDGLLTADSSGRVLLANPAAERMFGASHDELTGRHISELLPHRIFNEPLENLIGATVEVDARRLSEPHDGCRVEIAVNDMQVGGSRHFVALVRDIAERRRNEETLRQIGLGVSSATGEEFVNSLVTRLSQALEVDCAFIVEVEGQGTDTVHVITMAEKGNICGAGPCDLAGTACEEALKHGFRAYLEGVQERFPCDWLVAAFGAESLVCMPLVAHSGDYVGLLGVLDHRALERVDIVEATLQIFAARAAAEVERRRSERELANEKERLAVTLASIGDGCIAVDNLGRILLFNPVAARLTGWPEEAAFGMALPDIFCPLHAHHRHPLDRQVEALIATGKAQELAGPAILQADDGTERIVETTASPLTDPAGLKVGTVLILRDVTERHRTMEERQKAEKLESLGVVAGGIAHDFNNLLTAILGNLSLVLSTGRLEDSVSDRLASAKRASLRAQELATQLLTFAKGGAPIKQTASIGQMLRDTVTFHLRGSKVAPEFHIPETLWPVEVDAGQISQVIQNLTINADQAMGNGGTLRLSCSNLELHNPTQRLGLPPGRFIKIAVQDEGTGIADEHLKKIFDPYFTTKPKGSGLGLATSYSIVKNHGGVIDVVSHVGEGTTFYIFLPATDKPVMPAPEPQPVEHVVHTGAGRILVLDDEEAICALVRCALEPLGYEVHEAYDAATAIRVYKQAMDEDRRFDIVISDLTIPGGMGGEEALRRLRELDPNVRAIVSSGYAMDPVMSKFQEHGFCAMIAKPYEVLTLSRVVSEVLAQSPASKVIKLDFAAA